MQWKQKLIIENRKFEVSAYFIYFLLQFYLTMHILAISSLLLDDATTLLPASFDAAAQAPTNSNFYQVQIK